MAPCSSTVAWKIPWTEEPGRLQSIGSLRVWHNWLHFHFSLSCVGEGNGNPFQCSCLGNPRDGGAWWAAIYGVTQSRTWLKQLSSSSSSIHIYIYICICICMAEIFCCSPETITTLLISYAAAAESLQSCPTLYDPIDGSPPGSAVPGILQARTLEWVAISFSNTWKWKVKVKSLSIF